jgi:hypothetical protein
MRVGRPCEASRPAVGGTGRVDVLEVLTLVLHDPGAGQAGCFRVVSDQLREQGRTAAVQAPHEHESLVARRRFGHQVPFVSLSGLVESIEARRGEPREPASRRTFAEGGSTPGRLSCGGQQRGASDFCS